MSKEYSKILAEVILKEMTERDFTKDVFEGALEIINRKFEEDSRFYSTMEVNSEIEMLLFEAIRLGGADKVFKVLEEITDKMKYVPDTGEKVMRTEGEGCFIVLPATDKSIREERFKVIREMIEALNDSNLDFAITFIDLNIILGNLFMRCGSIKEITVLEKQIINSVELSAEEKREEIEKNKF